MNSIHILPIPIQSISFYSIIIITTREKNALHKNEILEEIELLSERQNSLYLGLFI